MSFKARFTWLGVCLVVVLLVINLTTIGMWAAAIMHDLPQSNGSAEIAPPAIARRAVVEEFLPLVMLINFSALPFLLLSLRLNRTVH